MAVSAACWVPTEMAGVPGTDLLLAPNADFRYRCHPQCGTVPLWVSSAAKAPLGRGAAAGRRSAQQGWASCRE